MGLDGLEEEQYILILIEDNLEMISVNLFHKTKIKYIINTFKELLGSSTLIIRMSHFLGASLWYRIIDKDIVHCLFNRRNFSSIIIFVCCPSQSTR